MVTGFSVSRRCRYKAWDLLTSKDQRKISYVAHTGDIIENNIRKSADEAMRQQVVGEFEVSSRQQRVLDDADIPNGVIAGNHDNQPGECRPTCSTARSCR
ncbi:hypothetical protein [Streptosporangium sp. CA-115845]|uniref:hypothetical protein n=1 Tax=Streptosporangium sp. CA-115845 TaxID=3240071 RepID=UPI003D9093BE